MSTKTRLTQLVVALSVALGLAACASGSPSVAEHDTITVSGTARVKVEPNVCSFSVGVVAEGDSASEAQRAMAEPLAAITKRLKELGVAEENIQTTYTDVSPQWDDDGRSDRYEARTNLQISNVAVDEAGALMEAATEAGATDVSGLQYQTTDYDTAYEEALTQAIEATRGKAEAIAQASKVSLGSIVSVTEGYQNTTYYAENKAMAMTEDAADDAGGMSVEPGQVEVSADVTVSYAIR